MSKSSSKELHFYYIKVDVGREQIRKWSSQSDLTLLSLQVASTVLKMKDNMKQDARRAYANVNTIPDSHNQ